MVGDTQRGIGNTVIFKKKNKSLLEQISGIDIKETAAEIRDLVLDQAAETANAARAIVSPVDAALVPKAGSNKAKVLLAYAALDPDDGASDAQIALLIGMTPQAVGTARRAFVKDGLVATYPGDGRFFITALGQRAVWALIANVIEPINQ